MIGCPLDASLLDVTGNTELFRMDGDAEQQQEEPVMSQILRLEIPDTLFAELNRQAVSEGSDPATVATSALKEHFHSQSPPLRDAMAASAFRGLFGAVDLGHPTGLDNDSLDADLVKEYARGLTN